MNLVLQGYFSRLHMCKFDQQEASIHSGKLECLIKDCQSCFALLRFVGDYFGAACFSPRKAPAEF